MNKIIFIIYALVSVQLYSQTPSWHALPNAPTTNIKFDDCFFINENTGWILGPSVMKTTNGGFNWLQQTAIAPRCIGFGDSLKGWLGLLNGTPAMYSTTNGGGVWLPVQNIPPPAPPGLCAFMQ